MNPYFKNQMMLFSLLYGDPQKILLFYKVSIQFKISDKNINLIILWLLLNNELFEYCFIV